MRGALWRCAGLLASGLQALDQCQALLHLGDADADPGIDVTGDEHLWRDAELVIGCVAGYRPGIDPSARGAADEAAGAEALGQRE